MTFGYLGDGSEFALQTEDLVPDCTSKSLVWKYVLVIQEWEGGDRCISGAVPSQLSLVSSRLVRHCLKNPS